ncbi:MAG: peptidoglycan-binding protein [Clostridia bacterium]|nr:peptidoglycan-binding protein [Clostridia bacterium]
MKSTECQSKGAKSTSSVFVRLSAPMAFIAFTLVILTVILPYIITLASGYTDHEYGDINPSAPLVVNTPTQTPTATVDVTDTPAVASPTPSVFNEVVFSQGDVSDQVALIQQRLMSLGYLASDEPGTLFGPALAEAVMLFQRAHYYAETGAITQNLLDFMMSDSALSYRIERGNKGNDVLTLQTRLEALGFYSSMLNGYFGYATETAVRSFQAMNELYVTGVADTSTLSVLYSPSAINSESELDAPTPTSTPTPTRTPVPTPTTTPTPTVRPTSTPGATPRPTSSPSSTPQPPTQTPAPTASPTPAPTPTPTSTPAPTPTDTPAPPTGGVEDFIAVAEAQLGKPYVWSTEGPDSFDCSGLVYYCLRQIGFNVPRYSAAGYSQVESWEYVGSISALRRGDLVFFRNDSGYISHVGIYLGNNQYIHASSSQGRVVISNWGSWSNTYFALGRRIF